MVHSYHGVRDAAQHDGMIICRIDGDGRMACNPHFKTGTSTFIEE